MNSHTALPYEQDITQCLTTLKSGGTILYPTDTIWGLGCDATNELAVEKIIALKNRPAHKSFVVLVAEEKDILHYVAAPDLAVFDYLQLATKPVTVIYDGALGLASNVVAPDGSVAIRICKDPFCRHLIKRFHKPIVSTSANLSGQPAPQIFADIDARVKDGAGYTVAYRRHDDAPAAASTIIRWKQGGPIIIRP